MNDKTKVEVRGPDATPPESNAMPEKSEGEKIIKIIAITYPGIKIYFKLKPLTALHNDSPIAIAVPTERKIKRNFLLIVPPETLSTCSLKTHTAGSAQTMIAPSKSPTTIKSTNQKPPFAIAIVPRIFPSSPPASENPPLTPVRKIVSPIKLYAKPIIKRAA